MARSRDRLPRWHAAALHALLIAVGATMLAPFAWMLLTSFKSEGEVFQRHLIPQAVTLGPAGTWLTTVDGQPLYDRDGREVRVRAGVPAMEGGRGDHARAGDGTLLRDDLGVPVQNGMIDPRSSPVRFRDPRLLAKYAEPVLVERGLLPPEHEAAAQRWFGRTGPAWEAMVAARWHGRVPLMMTTALQEAWTAATRPVLAELPAAMLAPGATSGVLIDPGVRGRIAYQLKDLAWDRSGEPVRTLRRANLVVDAAGLPIERVAAYPQFRGEDEVLRDAAGAPLAVRIGSPSATPGTILGANVARRAEVRLVTGNYQTVLTDPDFKVSLFAWNSLFVCAATVLLKLLTSSLAAFAFARLHWRGRDTVFIAYLATLMIPGVVTAIPNYLILQQLGWLDTFAALIIPGAATAYGTFMLRQFMLTLPAGLEEAARIDGAGLLRVWWDICVPLTRPALITLAIFTFAATWQSFSWPLIVAKDESVRVLPVALQALSDSQRSAYNLLMAASVLMMIPTVLLFLLGQRYFTAGMQVGAVKG